MKLYEGMFVIDNDLVREDWRAAKATVTGTLEKYGAKILSARRWDERALAYPIKGRRRATFLLTYFEIDGPKNSEVARDLEIQDVVLRYLVTAAEALPEGEVEASQAEAADDFVVPPPPADSVGRYRPLQGDDDGESEDEDSDDELGAPRAARRRSAAADEAEVDDDEPVASTDDDQEEEEA